MIDSGMLPYDSRSGGPDPLHRPMVPSHQFFSNPPYNPAPLTSMATSGYQQQQQQQQAAFTTYGSFPSSLTTMVSPFKPPSLERPQLPLGPMSKPEGAGGYEYPKDRRSSYVSGSPSPSVKSEAQMSSARSVASSRSSVARTITSNAPVGNATQIDFNTSVDALMKAIQSKDETETIVKKVEAQQMPQVPVARSPEQEQPEGGRANRKRYQCDIAGCTRAFYQKTHLEIHRRAHTGDKPYICKQPNCGHRFSQLGNLRTHERRHTGERPYKCDQCGKSFAQRGNVRAHLRTHLEAKPFQCKLDGCNKNFTQLGNLKSHQNKFHGETLKVLTTKFATLKEYDSVCKADRELWEYFAALYKNSNKGIKGRGKDRRVGSVTHPSPTRLGGAIPSQFPMVQPPVTAMHHQRYHQQQQQPPQPSPSQQQSSQPQQLQNHHHHQAPQHLHHPLPHHGLSHPASYSISRPSILVSVAGRDSHNTYEMYSVDGVNGGGNTSATSDAVYEDDQGRELAFGDRMY